MTGILPVYSRSPALIAQTAITIDTLSEGRFVLGLGTSGPQVIEGWHGVAFKKPLGMTRDVIEICRKVWSGDKVEHEGRAFNLPLADGEGTGLGKPLKLMCKPYRRDIPIAVASIGPKNVEMTAELANMWQPIHFLPEKFHDMELAFKGLPKRGFQYTFKMIPKSEQEAEEIQDLFLSGKRDEAFAKVPDDYVDRASLTGDEGRVRERIEVYKEVGVTYLNIDIPADTENPLEVIEKVKAWAE